LKTEARVRDIEGQLATLRAVNESVALERDGLERDVATLTEALASSRAGHERTKEERDAALADVARLTKERDEWQRMCARAECRLDKEDWPVAKECESLYAELGKVLADVARLTAERDRWEAKARQGLSMLNDEVGVSISLRADVARLTDTLSCLKSFDHEVAQRISDEVIALRAEVFRLRLDYGKAKAERDASRRDRREADAKLCEAVARFWEMERGDPAARDAAEECAAAIRAASPEAVGETKEGA
jgi:chromosome segregation ATPase